MAQLRPLQQSRTIRKSDNFECNLKCALGYVHIKLEGRKSIVEKKFKFLVEGSKVGSGFSH